MHCFLFYRDASNPGKEVSNEALKKIEGTDDDENKLLEKKSHLHEGTASVSIQRKATLQTVEKVQKRWVVREYGVYTEIIVTFYILESLVI